MVCSYFCSKRIPCCNTARFCRQIFFWPSCINSSWGIGVEVAKKEFYTLPETFEITWLSLVEQKFYKGKWQLPENIIERYLNQEEKNKNDKFNCKTIQLGLAPKGMVIVWLIGDDDAQIEIGRFQASETILNKDDVYDSAKFMFEKGFSKKKLSDPKFLSNETRENINKHGYPAPNVYNLYRQKYIWNQDITVPEGGQIISVKARMCNGECQFLVGKSIFNPSEKKAIPYLFIVKWKDNKNQDFITKIAFSEDNEYWQKDNAFTKEGLPLNFDKGFMINQFKNKSEISTTIGLKIDNDSTAYVFLEQNGKQLNIPKFSQETRKIVKKAPCICK
ncbi:DUF2931 family protein [Flavobacterium sp. MMS24-S5]|uniref:DUF2931 family protein n=1 Tax=Flavobacterium sp. MMS24-S5 TaxID=3416605 RepID=UPI003CFDBB33